MVSMETIFEVKHNFYGSKALLTLFSITHLVGQQELRNANSQTYWIRNLEAGEGGRGGAGGGRGGVGAQRPVL